MNSSQTEAGRLVELTTDECWTLADTQPVGRLAWQGPHGVTIVPVNFVLTGRDVHLRTTAYSALARECDDSEVAFEVDQIDVLGHSGWSVLMRGRAHLSFGEGSGEQPDVWPGGIRGLQVTLDVTEVTGRRLG